MRQPKERSSGGFVFGIILVVFGVIFILEGIHSGVITLSPIIASIVGIIIIYIYIRDTFLLKAVEIKQNNKAQVPEEEIRSNRMQLLNELYSIAEEQGGFRSMRINFSQSDGITLVAENGSFSYSFEELGYSGTNISFTKTAVEFAIEHGLLYSFGGYRDFFDQEPEYGKYGFDALEKIDKIENRNHGYVTVFAPKSREDEQTDKKTYKLI